MGFQHGKPIKARQKRSLIMMMEERRIKLPTVADAKEFVTRASQCDFDIDVYYNRVIIDAKSLLGVLSLDLTRVLTVSMHGKDEAFCEYLDQLAARTIAA